MRLHIIGRFKMSFSAFGAYIISTLHQTFKRFRRICEMQPRRWPLLSVKCFDNNAIVVRHYVDFIFLLSQIKQVSTHNYTRALPITYGCFSFSRLICMLKQSAVYIHTLLIPLKQTLWAEDRNFWFAVKLINLLHWRGVASHVHGKSTKLIGAGG